VSQVIAFIATLALLVSIGVSPSAVHSEIVVHASEAYFSFGQHITFHLQAESPAMIIEINLFLRIQGQSATIPVPISFEPSQQVSIDHVYSLAGQSIPPFAFVTYWWELGDGNGEKQRSLENLLYYADNRYDWRGPVQDQRQGITWEVYWVDGDILFGQTALNTGIEALDEIYRDLQAPAPGVIRIYIYPSEEDLRSALYLGGYDWAGGQARPELGVVLVGIPNDMMATGEMQRLIPHELTHLLVYQAAGRTLDRVPPWLDEGLASLHELRPDPNRQALVDQALAAGHLIPLKALCAPFPLDEAAARLAYAQSAGVVHYVREKYGSQAIRDLLAVYADHAGCEAGVSRALGVTLDGLDSAWRASLTGQGQVSVALNDSAVWLALWLLTALLALPLVGAWRSSRQQKQV